MTAFEEAAIEWASHLAKALVSQKLLEECCFQGELESVTPLYSYWALPSRILAARAGRDSKPPEATAMRDR
jgi:hypothetical protein